MILAYNANGLLCLWMHGNTEPDFTWTYSVFELYNQEALTPSMYKFMAEYVRLNFNEEDYVGSYHPGELEEDAFVRYYELSVNHRIRLHNEMMNELDTLRMEEEMWRGGHEFGSENDLTQPLYNHYDEF